MSEGAVVAAREFEPIARTYAELQSLPRLLDATRMSPKPEPGSADQAVRALFQAIEVTVVNLEHLAWQAGAQARSSSVADVVSTLDWMVSFGRCWVDLAWRIGDVCAAAGPAGAEPAALRSSPNWSLLCLAENDYARALDPLVRRVEKGEHDPQLADLSRLLIRYMMQERVGLEYACSPNPYPEYADLVHPITIRAAVLEYELPAGTVLMQFRAAHQMPEILVEAANDHLQAAIEHIAGGRFASSLSILRRADRLLDATVALTDLLVDRLTMDAYHEIRAGLGLTSGSHSVGLHFHLMRDLAPALQAVIDDKLGSAAETETMAVVQELVRSIIRHVDRWRLAHINLPRMNLGAAAAGTRSLTGSPDAIGTVTRMREQAHAVRQPDGPSARFRATDWQGATDLAMADIERRLLAVTAKRTQERFGDVQNRSGYFAGSPDFRPPRVRRTWASDVHA
jgi:hypothetical protein